ncbi:unnamed protein product [Cladocopium goreaui]|uniref:RNA-editing substrate-binding complex 6 protein domain-containing protein n=1 Tax=Cladocopium goreaui TaxID=2562237 RepID=A0A9P1CQE7_9DINO|nr:unnamed protein product [Cladocopium goreaui]
MFCARRLWHSTVSTATLRPKAPKYLQIALHKDLSAAVQEQQPRAVLAIFSRFVKHVEQADVADVDATLNALVKSIRPSSSPGVQEDGQTGSAELEENELQPLLSSVEDTLNNCDSAEGDAERVINNLAWALASLHGESRQELKARVRSLFQKVQEISHRMLETHTANHLSRLGWAVARMNLGGPGEAQLLQDLGDAALKHKAQWSAQDVSLFTWSFATLQTWHPVLHEVRVAALRQGRSNLQNFGEQDLSNFTWGLAKLQIRDQELMKMVGKEVEAKLFEFSHMGLVCTIWGFASLRLATPFLSRALDHIRASNVRMTPKDSTMLLWSMATLRHDTQRELLYHHVADHVIVPGASQFQAQDVSICLWAFCTARVDHPRVFRALVAQIAEREMTTSFTSQALANATWACAKMRAEATQMVKLATQEALRRPMRDWSPQAIVTLIWSSSEAQMPAVELLIAMLPELQRRPQAFNDRDLASLVYALKEALWPLEHAESRRTVLKCVSQEISRRHLPATVKMFKFLRSPPAAATKSRAQAQPRMT